MYSLESLWDIMRLEMFLGHSHECHSCGKTFLAHEDGCPNCGVGARVTSLHPPVQLSDCKTSDSGYCIVYGEETGACIVGHGDFSPWPRT